MGISCSNRSGVSAWLAAQHCHAGQQGCQTHTPCALSRICSSASSACEGCTTHCRQHKQTSADLASRSMLPGSGCRAAGLLLCRLQTSRLGWQCALQLAARGKLSCGCCELGCSDCRVAGWLLCTYVMSRLGLSTAEVLTGCQGALSCGCCKGTNQTMAA